MSDAVWPALGYETLPWEADDTLPASRTARRPHRGPYQAALVAKIADRVVALPSSTAALVDDAAAEVARFDVEVGQDIARFGAVLLRSESAASSKIENLTASARAIAEAELRPSGTGNASMIVANEHAMSAAIALATPSWRCTRRC